MLLYFLAAAEALFNSLLSFDFSFVALFLFFAIIFLMRRTVLSGVSLSFLLSWFLAEFAFLVVLFAFLVYKTEKRKQCDCCTSVGGGPIRIG